jgi:F-type H+-transporting ATPase subunit b
MLLAEKKAKTLLKSAKDQSAEILNMAHKQAGDIVEESKVSAKKEGDRLIVAAKVQIDQEMLQSKEKLRKEVAILAVTAAEQILVAEIDQTKHQALVDKFAKSL